MEKISINLALRTLGKSVIIPKFFAQMAQQSRRSTSESERVTKLQKTTISFMSVRLSTRLCSHGTTRLPLDGFS